MLTTRRHWAHRFIHEAIIDLLQIQKGFTFFAWDYGRNSCWFWIRTEGYGLEESNLLLASCDEVALDSVAAKIIGFDPLKMDYLSIGKTGTRRK